MYEDDESEEVLSESQVASESISGAAASDIETVEEHRGLASRDEIASSLDRLDEDVDVEDLLGLFSPEDAVDEVEPSKHLDEAYFAVRDISQALTRSMALHVVGDAVEELLQSSRNANELTVISNELARVFSNWLGKPEPFSYYLEEFIFDPSGEMHRFSHSWVDTWSRALSKAGEIEDEHSRIQVKRELASAFDVWPWKSVSERSWLQSENDRWFYLQAHEILGVVDRIESGLWTAKGLDALASFAKTLRSGSERLPSLIDMGFEPHWVYPKLTFVSGDRDRVLAIHNMNFHTADLLGVEALLDPEIFRTSPSEIVPPGRHRAADRTNRPSVFGFCLLLRR